MGEFMKLDNSHHGYENIKCLDLKDMHLFIFTEMV